MLKHITLLNVYITNCLIFFLEVLVGPFYDMSTLIGLFNIIYVYIGWLVGFYGISTFGGYLMPNPFFMPIVSSISNNSV